MADSGNFVRNKVKTPIKHVILSVPIKRFCVVV